MRILVLSDIHANLTALESVFNHAGTVDATWCLGDVVGYGPDPNECIAALKRRENLMCLMGNHDAAALGRIQLEAFNQDARRSIEWLQDELTPESYLFINSLPEKLVIDDVTLTHGSPRNPVWEYILDLHSASINFKHFKTKICMVGHTHLPIAYVQQQMDNGFYDVQWFLTAENTPYNVSSRVILNPGSTGQPRDHDPRASFAIYDSDSSTWEIFRVSYDINSVQRRIKKKDLPSRHATRLVDGW
jgi:diadenosine tetraphosphatase ApaH/serine/threonine PP2A family protein phosphatase